MSTFQTPARRFWAIGSKLALLLSPLVFPVSALAWPPTYGGELEVSDSSMISKTTKDLQGGISNEKKRQMAMVEKMRERCLSLGCTVVEVKGKWDKDYVVEHPDGWWFKISYDPSAVEIPFKPLTLAELNAKARRDQINDEIFATAKAVHLTPNPKRMNHFNIGARSAFGTSGKDFLRFFIDYTSRPDLALGTLGIETENSPPLSILGADQREALNEVVRATNAGELVSVNDVAKAIQEKVYTASSKTGMEHPEHDQAIGLKHVNKTDLSLSDAPFELRAIFAQASAERFALLASLFEGRIAYLNGLEGPIIYTKTSRTAKSFTPQEMKSRFFIWVEEAHMKYADYESLLPDSIRNSGFDNFVNTAAPLKKRLSSVEGYWDLLPTSEWVRAQFVDLMSQPGLDGYPEAAAIFAKLKLLAEQQDELVQKTLVISEPTSQTKSFFKRLLGRMPPAKQALPTSTANSNPYKDVSTAIFQRKAVAQRKARLERQAQGYNPMRERICQRLFM